MSAIFKKSTADKMAFKHQPKSFKIETSAVASEFVTLQQEQSSDFQIADVVATQAGIEALRKKNIETQVEGTVLERLKEIEEQAYAKAYELGMMEGKNLAFEEKRQELETRLQKLDSFLQALENRKINIFKENEIAIMKMIFQIAEKIAIREITLSQEPVVALLNSLVTEVQGADAIIVKLSPEDLAFIEGLRLQKVKDVERLENVKLVSSEDIETGGAIIQTNFGEIDATIPERVEKAWAVLTSKLPILKKEDPTTP